MKSLREKIGEIPIFPGLTREDVAKLLDKMEECSFSAGAIIFSQGDTSDASYFIESGSRCGKKRDRKDRKLFPNSDRRLGLDKGVCLAGSSVPQL
jgi:hypothetical protein